MTVWLPNLWALQAHGGYAAVAANHRTYLVGWSGWPAAVAQQFWNLRYLDGWASHLAPSCALLAVWIAFGFRAAGFTWNGPSGAGGTAPAETPATRASELWAARARTAGRIRLASLLFVGSVLWTPTPTLLLVLLLAVGVGIARRGWEIPIPKSVSGADGQRLAVWMLAAWWLGLLLTTPLYRPYARLVLPWLAASWIGGGAVLAWLAQGTGARKARANPPRAVSVYQRYVLGCLAFTVAILAAAAFLGGERLVARGVVGWQPRDGLERIAAAIAQETSELASAEPGGERDRKVVYVYAEPSVLFQMRLLGVDPVRPVSDLRFARPTAEPLPVPVFLVTGPHAERDPRFAAQLEDVRGRLILVRSYEYTPSDLVLLDSRDPRDLLPAGRPFFSPPRKAPATEQVRLYRVAPR
jgi:hypothetical protein